MKVPNAKRIALSVLGMAAALALATSLRMADAAPRDAMAERLQRLEDREQILELLTAYGMTLDRRDFDAFGRLFAEDATYGSPRAPTHGRAAIQASLEKTLTSNPSNLPAPNSHLLFNPSIHVDGDKATAQSKGAYTAPDAATKSTQMVFFVTYEDKLVRRNGRWLFQERLLK
jgi:ketosteroid isomerase-like protein